MVHTGSKQNNLLGKTAGGEGNCAWVVGGNEKVAIREGTKKSDLRTLGEVLQRPSLIPGILRANKGWLIVCDPVKADFYKNRKVWKRIIDKNFPVKIVMKERVIVFGWGIDYVKFAHMIKFFKQE